MREGWKEVLLGEILEIKHGYGFKGEYFTELETTEVLVTPGNFYIGGGFKNDKLKFYKGPINENFILKENDVIVTMTDLSKKADTIGFSAKIPMNSDKIYLHNQRIGLVNLLDNSFDLNFIYWLLRTNSYQRYIAGSAIGATVKHTSPSKIYTAKVKVPTNKDTQRKIANILSGYDDLIENNQKRIKILEEMAQQTYEEWFVRMRFPGYETAVFDENGLPEGWQQIDLNENITIKHGYAFKGEYFKLTETNRILLTPGNFRIGGGIKLDKLKYYDENIDLPKEYILQKHDLLVTMTDLSKDGDTLGYPLLVPSSCDKIYLHNQRLGKIIPKDVKCFPKYFLRMYFQDHNYRSFVVGSANGATVKHTSPTKILFFKPFLPPFSSEIISRFDSFAKPLFEVIDRLLLKQTILKESRDILLPRLMMGMIDVSESLVQVESVEAKPTDAKIIPLEQPKKEASKEFKEAVLIACLTDRFGSEKFPLGRKRYTKLSYLFHRYSDNKIQDYLRKAAGPYNPKTKYGGPEKIALQNKYIQNWKSDNKLTGFVSAEKIEDAKTYFSNYWQIADLDWLTAEFKFKSNDELELLATVDNSLVELSKKNLDLTSANVLDIIKSEKEWEAKLERTIFSNANVERAIGFLRGVLEYGK